MSLWGNENFASNANLNINVIFTHIECLGLTIRAAAYSILYPVITTEDINIEILEYIGCCAKLSEDNTNLIIPRRIRANKRIGPHEKIVLEIIFGCLLGDGHAEYRSIGNGTRITFYQEGTHVSYLLWLHGLLSDLGYCSPKTPEIKTRLGSKGIVRKIIRFRTWTYTSFNWIKELWYVNNVKVVPNNIAAFLSPLALAIWIMDDGSKVNQGLKLCTNSFTYSDCLLLVKVLYENFNLKASVQSSGVHTQYIIYIWKESMPKLREIVIPYVHSSMKYKLIN